MRKLFTHIHREADRFKDHPFIKTYREADVHGAFAVLSSCANSFIHLAMTFRDTNTLYFMYDDPKDEYEKIVDAHARADAEHWQLLLDDLDALSLNVNRSTNDFIRTVWRDEDLYVREYIYGVLARAYQSKDTPIRRMAAMETIESVIDLLSYPARRNSALYREQLGIDLNYFGKTHVETELGTKADTAIFEEIELDAEEYKFCLAIVEDHFECYSRFLDNKQESAAHALQCQPPSAAVTPEAKMMPA